MSVRVPAGPWAVSLLLFVVPGGCEPSEADGALRSTSPETADYERIVSLVPAATEVLLAVGAGDRLVARTRYDEDPRLGRLPSVGGSLDPNLEELLRLQPDLVVTWEGGRRGSPARRLEGWGVAVHDVRIRGVDDVLREIRTLGALAGHARAARHLVDSISTGLEELRGRRAAAQENHRPTVLYVLWGDPLRTTGPETFVAELIRMAGGRVLFADAGQAWPLVSFEQVLLRDPEVILVASDSELAGRREWREPGSRWQALRAVRSGRVHAVEASLFNRPGPRLLEAALVVENLLHDGIRAGR